MFIAAVCVICAGAQQAVLVSKAPVYKANDVSPISAEIIDDVAHVRLSVTQRVLTLGTTTFLVSERYNRSDPVGAILIDPSSWKIAVIDPAHVSETVVNTCTDEVFYPIILHKTIRCITTFRSGDDVVEYRSTIVYDHVERDQSGTVTAICSKQQTVSKRGLIVSETCSTADGKWLVREHILYVGPYSDI